MKKPKLIPILLVALLVSLSVNLYIGGHHLGRFVSAGPCDRQEWRAREEALKENLSPADYDIVRAHKAEKKKLFRADRERLDDARIAVERAMQAEPFDQAALDAALEQERVLKADMLQRMRASRDALKAELSPEGRQIFDDVLKAHRPAAPAHGGPGPRE